MSYMNNKIELPTNKKFGLVFFIFFVILSTYFFINDNLIILPLILICLAIIFLTLAILNSSLLSPFNLLWFKFGLLLGKIVNPLIMGIFFFILITPISLITKLFGRDELRIKRKSVTTYWINKDTAQESTSFKNQY